jgi:hypothetical protein
MSKDLLPIKHTYTYTKYGTELRITKQLTVCFSLPAENSLRIFKQEHRKL